MTMQTIKTKSLTGKDLTVTYGWVTKDKVVSLDGDKVTVAETKFVLTAEVEGLGKIDNVYMGNHEGTDALIGKVMYKGKLHRVAVLIDSETYEAITAARDKQRTRIADPLVSHPGYCPKCKSVCYGDCEAN
jgi:hypothetical protein